MTRTDAAEPIVDPQTSPRMIVFAGPSTAEIDMRKHAVATYAPPVRRGDLASVQGYDIIVIVDGEFGQSMSVSPKEILGLIEQGKTVIGASSMGALRASELDRCGMIGVGWVYDYFRRSAVRRDGDVALVYSPFDMKPITVPMVDLEFWMEGATRAGLVPRRDGGRLLKAARGIFFADRTSDRLMDALRRAVGTELLEALLAFSDGAIPSVKSLDAVEAVRFGASLVARAGDHG
ncbi:TfuA-like protein [Bradyrhizobium sp. LTSPM299]|uniref:TfuA-like protein n=1 Tax=Bradyrhizobium sp. LTSPM299 TaxID=1619233 RepID=UPI0006796CFB|nr:TfuA-like protein [Bradyrhizobium sp. LTSPM299]